MTSKQQTNDIITKIIDEMPGGPARDAAHQKLNNLPSVSIHGDIAQMAITLSGPINFTVAAKASRKP